MKEHTLIIESGKYTQVGIELKGYSICLNTRDRGRGLVGGFSRLKDAEIARDTLEKLNVDWTGTGEEVCQSLADNGFDSFEQIKEKACEHLQW